LISGFGFTALPEHAQFSAAKPTASSSATAVVTSDVDVGVC